MIWVVKPILSEESILILNKENLLKSLADCSKFVIIEAISLYISNKFGSPEVIKIVEDAYGSKVNFEMKSNDKEFTDFILKVGSYSIEDVHAGLTIQELQNLKNDILSVHKKEENVPYIEAISKENIEHIISNLAALYRVNKNPKYKTLYLILSKNKELFKDKPRTRAKGTIYKPIFKKSEEFDIMLRGIDFLIKNKENSIPTESWRIF